MKLRVMRNVTRLLRVTYLNDRRQLSHISRSPQPSLPLIWQARYETIHPISLFSPVPAVSRCFHSVSSGPPVATLAESFDLTTAPISPLNTISELGTTLAVNVSLNSTANLTIT